MAFSRTTELHSVTADPAILPLPYGALSRYARLIIAMRCEMRETDLEVIAQCVRLKPRQVEKFWGMVKRHPAGKAVIRRGLPAMYGEILPDGCRVICQQCGSLITHVPCVRCCQHQEYLVDTSDVMVREGREKIPRLDAEPTQLMPGSLEKIQLLRRRVAANRQPHHPNDYKIHHYERM